MSGEERGRPPLGKTLWKALREAMPVVDRWAYFDHAAVAPLPAPTRDAITRWVDEATESGDRNWPDWADRVEQGRHLAAKLIGASAGDVAFVSNTTTGIGIVAEGYPWQADDQVVYLTDEFPSNVYPWLNLASRGVEPVGVDRPSEGWSVEAILSACTPRTRLIAVSWVGYATGERIDVAALVEAAHARGIEVFLDAIQGLGVFPLDVSSVPVDYLAADGHKWLLGPEGAGILYIRRQHLQKLRPMLVGWHSVEHAHDFSRLDWRPRPTAARYEGGSWNMAGLLGLTASLELLTACGAGPTDHRLADRVLTVTDWAREALQPLGVRFVSPPERARSSGILAFDLPAFERSGGDLATVRRRAVQAGVLLSVRGGHLRISPHAYNDRSDIDRLIDVLSSVVSPSGMSPPTISPPNGRAR